MVVIHPDLTIVDTLHLTNPGEWRVRGHLRSSFRTITSVLGTPDFGVGAEDTSPLWLVATPAGPAQLQNWLDGQEFLRNPDTQVDWSIQTPTVDVMPWLFKTLTNSTAAFPHAGSRLLYGASRAELCTAYLRYLRVRAHTARAELDLLRHAGVDRWEERFLAADDRWMQAESMRVLFEREQLWAVTPPSPLGPREDVLVRDEHIATVHALKTANLPRSATTATSGGAR